MFTKLFALLSCIGVIALQTPINKEIKIDYQNENQNVLKQRNYQHSEMLNSYTEITYKFETNEVNSIDDYVVGHTYLLQFDFTLGQPSRSNLVILNDNKGTFVIESIKFDNLYRVTSNIDNSYPLDFMRIYTNGESDNYIIRCDGIDNNSSFSVRYLSIGSSNFYALVTFTSIVDYTWFTNNTINYLTELPIEYNEIESVTYIKPTTVVGVINEFCETYLFSEIPLVQQMTFTIGGQQVNLMTWLIIVVGLVLSAGLLVLLFCFFKWLFLLFAGIFKR